MWLAGYLPTKLDLHLDAPLHTLLVWYYSNGTTATVGRRLSCSDQRGMRLSRTRLLEVWTAWPEEWRLPLLRSDDTSGPRVRNCPPPCDLTPFQPVVEGGSTNVVS